jgi:alpha-L-fucosidase
MRRRNFITTAATATALTAAGAGAAAPAAAHPAARAGGGRRSGRGNRYRLQRRFVDWRFGMFIHFNMGTFHDAEWVEPFQDPLSFNPTELDCGQWADAAKAAGMKFAVLTAKHHDGFCLWPSKYTTYDVMSSSYRHDVVREYMDAFRSRGITPCLYFSIWDRTNGVGPPDFGQVPITREMIDLVKNQLTELLTRYGKIPLLIFDGWSWHWSFGHQTLPWSEIRAHVAALQPDCLVFDLNGLTVPWDSDLLFIEEPKGGVFCPPGNTYAASQGVSVSAGGWFWHPATPATVMSADEIVDGHLNVLEPRYCSFILNVPPNPRGLLDQSIVDTLRETGARWRPDRSRPPLPAQPDVLRHPVTPVAVTSAGASAAAAADGHNDFGWNGQADQTLWTSAEPPGAERPQAVTLDLGRVFARLDTLAYLPRQDTVTDFSFDEFITAGNITGYRVSVSVDGTTFKTVARGSWAGDHTLKQVRFRPATARYVRLEALSAAGGGPAVVSEIECGGTNIRPRPV